MCVDCVCADPFSEEEEMEGDEETRPEYMCPFCAEDFDMVGLCCHIDEEHMVEAKNGVSFILLILHILLLCVSVFMYVA